MSHVDIHRLDNHRSAERVVADQLSSAPLADRLPPKLVNPEQGARLTGLSESTFYELLRAGKIASFKVGRRRVIPVAAIEEWIATELAEAGEQ